jgi:hypothetical protein
MGVHAYQRKSSPEDQVTTPSCLGRRRFVSQETPAWPNRHPYAHMHAHTQQESHSTQTSARTIAVKAMHEHMKVGNDSMKHTA